MTAHLHLVLAELGRDRVRTVLTVASIMAAFFLFGLLDTVRESFVKVGESTHGAKRLITSSRLSLTEALPVALWGRIATIDGIIASAHASWFAGYYQHPQNQLAAYAVSASYFDAYPEIEVDPWAMREFQNTRNAVLVGEGIARRFGWEVGQSIPIMSALFPGQAGHHHWDFVVVGIVRTSEVRQAGFYANLVLLRWDFISAASPYLDGRAGWYISVVGDASQSDRVANLIDELSLNSPYQTRTISEQGAFAAQIRQWADVDLIARSIMGAVFFSLLFLTSSVMAQSVRARQTELAILQAVGFSIMRIGALVVSESLILLLMGGVSGLSLAFVCLLAVEHFSGGMLSLSAFSLASWERGLVLMLGLGLVVGLVPVLKHSKSRPSQMLSRS